MIYCFDTSAFIAAWVESYPIDVTPRLWSELLPGLIAAGRLVTPKDVLLELEKKADTGLHEWVEQSGSVVELDTPDLMESARIVNTYRRLIEHKPKRSGADPIVIAVASARKAAVVTKEGLSGTLAKPKIPDVCKEEKIPCLKLLDVFRKERWRFE
ncbi:MAG: DUF4411 family protein [Myxococcaceae bacterium]|nr:DUF4411 family protein [Myxococcaceae bacterium]MCA3011560.1 DUF4411 family protein [Myxococcaceae bacterium]